MTKKTNPELKVEDILEDQEQVALDFETALTPDDLQKAVSIAQGQGAKPEEQEHLKEIFGAKPTVWETLVMTTAITGSSTEKSDKMVETLINMVGVLSDALAVQRKIMLDKGMITDEELKKATEAFYKEKKKAEEKAKEAHDKADKVAKKDEAKK